MIRGVGIDIMDIDWISRNIVRTTFCQQVYTETEIIACKRASSPAVLFAECYALKEACMKALGKGIRQGLWFKQIEINLSTSGSPIFTLYRAALKSYQASGATRVQASVAHENHIVIAVVLLI